MNRLLSRLGVVHYRCAHLFWIRFRFLSWRGFVVRDIRVYPLLFSERNGFTSVYFLRLWWAVSLLKPKESDKYLSTRAGSSRIRLITRKETQSTWLQSLSQRPAQSPRSAFNRRQSSEAVSGGKEGLVRSLALSIRRGTIRLQTLCSISYLLS